jgi:uncharacterized delta-60 repeat protein
MARKRSSSRVNQSRIDKILRRKSPARRRTNFVRNVGLGVERLEPRWVLAAGALDTTFDPIDLDGVLIGNLGAPSTANVRFNTITTQSDGKILAAGSYDVLSNNQQDFLVARFNAIGSLDTTFGVDGPDAGSAPDGFINFDFSSPSGQYSAEDITLDATGRIIVVGSGPAANNFLSWTVARLTPNGLLDTTFNGTGKVVTQWTDVFGNVGAAAHGVAVQADGKIVVAGDVRNSTFISNIDWGLARYNDNGTLDTSFGAAGTGKVVQDFFTKSDQAFDVEIQSDGKIVAGGYARPLTGTDDFALARYNASGILDPTFGTGGLVNTNIVPTSLVSQDRINAITIQPNGQIVATGWTDSRQVSVSNDDYDFIVARYQPSGALDTTFPATPAGSFTTVPGTQAIDFGFHSDKAAAVGIQADGKYVIAGTIDSSAGIVGDTHDDNDAFGLARLATNGSIDPTFGSSGRTITRISDYVPGTIPFAFMNDMALQPDGKILATGYTQTPDGHEKFVIARYESGLATQTIAGPADINEGQTYTLTLSSNDPTTTQWTINWGNGTQVVAGNPTSVTHVYPDGNANYTISATVTTATGTVPATNTVAVNVHNVAPTLAISGASDVNEGSTYTLSLSSSDPGTDTITQWTINWGDGTQVIGGNPSSVTHVYADGNASRTISATATDEDGTFAAGNTVSVAVHNAAPTLAISGGSDVNEGSSYVLSLSAADPGTDTITSWTINWGDGTQVVSGNPSSASHTYADGDANYTISAMATDEDGTFAAGNTVAIAVHNVAPTLAISGASDVNEGSPYTLSLSSLDPGTDTISQWTINWGDTTEVVSGNPLSATHTYADGNAAYTISAAATDEDGTFSANTVGVTVHDVAPTLAISGAASANEGSSYTLNLSKSDPGADTISQWTINWGDSTQVVSGNPASVSHTYADGDTNYTISATATDEEGTYAAGNTVLVAVLNVAPALALSGAADVDEASSYTLNLSSLDPGTDTISQWTINWGDGSQIVSGNPSSVSHTYADGNAAYTISATATDEDGTFAAGNTVGVAIHNVAPTLALSGASDVNEASSYTLNLSSSDPGADTIVNWTINWGDGTEVVSGNPSSVSHTYADGNASRTISATATDEDGTFGAGNTVAVTVHNVAPTLAISGASDTNEGSSYTLNLSSSDPGADTIASWTINWGDGSEVVSGSPASVSHTYADGGASYTISATATDEDGTFAAGTTVGVTVHNVAPTLTLSGASDINEGSSYMLNLSSSDPGSDTIASWTINWGDATEIVSGNPTSGSHTYADGNASYTISATATDEDGTFTAGNTVAVAVHNVAPTLTLSGASSVSEGSSYTLGLLSSDPGADTISQWTINWGDSTEVVSGNPSSVSHTYADGTASYTISATATDEDGTFGTGNTVGVTVTNVAPTLALSGASSVNEGSSYTLNLSKSDPGADTINHWTINWGDGTQTVSGSPASVTHVYADGTVNYAISATATDEDGTFAAGNTVHVTVNNVAPTANPGGPYATFDDTPITLTGSGTDPAGAAADPLTFKWDLDGDGVFGETGSGATRGNEVGANVTYNPTGLPTSTQTVKLQVSDGDGGETVATTTVQILNTGTLVVGGVLYIVGGNSTNDIVLITQCNNTISVIATFNSNNPMTFNASAITDIQVRTRGGNDIVLTTSDVMETMTIDGGTGNDLLTGGGARSVIIGGTGNDILYGASGNDILLGGDGNDDLFGGDGNDVLVGGNGNDILNGGNGRDVLIGSQDEDSLDGGNDEDILIGGVTVHDNNVAALDSIMAIWGSSASFSSRVATLSSSGGLLQAGVTVFDDDDHDQLVGNAGRDLYFGDNNPADHVTDSISLQAMQDQLIAVT